MKPRSTRARVAFVILTIVVLTGVFMVRLVDLQIVQAETLNAEADTKRTLTRVTYGTRGDIVDTKGAVLADSVERFDIVISPRVTLLRENASVVVLEDLTKITDIIGGDPDELLAMILDNPESDFEYLAKGITLEQYQTVGELGITWLYYELSPERSYPNGEIAGNLVGFIGTDGPQAGVELTGDECLAGQDVEASYARGEDGVALPGSAVESIEPQDGGTLALSIDRDLQFYVQQRMAQTAESLGATWATGVVMRVSDAHLLAVSDWPTVDPNNVDLAERGALGSRAFSTPYEPGSTVKALTAASLIDAGVANQQTQVVSPYALELTNGGGTISDSFYHEDQQLTLAGALVESSNTAIAQYTDLLDAASRHDYLQKFGLGEATGIGFNGESSGTLYEAKDWDARTNYAVQFGQGLSTTSIQMASAYQALGNDGVRLPPVLVEGCTWPDGTVTDTPSTEGTRVISETAADQTLQMMEMVYSASGSAPNLQIPGYRVAVKSGTAQVAENGAYGSNVVISYAGLAPADDPEYIVIATAGIPDSIYSGAIASTFRDIMAQTLTTYRVTPSNTSGPDLPLRW
ncbi:penicillin-binding protein 2 [Salinibacterium sp. NSLL150]|uniref:peptidoglycan D,D-transpeptidase FtsI family protein n=1 Tax=unclassified Salinibacterium TaxID=2632331 RepID=UPI0018CED8CE|nr:MULTISPECIES: penicillin-binding protein 2 [unclassified Salinibacterium]MBH0099258.1 penicillin-binding protein 2 [Salinibacterium sp. NSLL35]MBH0102012.1 penicillin-binding protein 2 [Salinibacterium sp. NSLL150]MBH0104772.1 penicillin-binding protein 2 [Salinibacterium sp. NSLL16]MBH0107532.1 penicillin-binding protein 2 [Salinibacterium sp. NSLL17]